MSGKAVKAHVYTWIAEDFAEFWKFIGLSLDGPALDDTTISVINDDDVQTYEITTRCKHCDRVFPGVEFDLHVCEFSDPSTIIFDDEKMDIIWGKSALKKMYEENISQIEKILHQYGHEVDGRPKDVKKPLVIQGNYECTVCHRIYVHASGLSRHMETQHKIIETNENIVHHPPIAIENDAMAEAIKCLICGRIFSSFPSCFAHLKTAHTEFGFDESNHSLQAGESLLFEKLMVDQVIQCEFCDVLFADTNGLLQHKNTHSINTGYGCSSCQLASRNLKFILNHRNNECPYEMYEKNPAIGCKLCFACSECLETFDSLAVLYEHRYSQRHLPNLLNPSTGETEFFCEKCGQMCGTDPNELIAHVEQVHTKRGRIQGLAASTATRPYLCEVCGKGYTQSSHLYQHLRFHKGIKPFECTKDGCNRKFTIRPDLNDHIRKCHTGERPYECSDCHKTFLTGSVYYQHRLIHRNERRYGCRTCDKRFHRSDALKNHERIHSGEKPYACGVCIKTFRQKGDRDKHFRSRHQNESAKQAENPSQFLLDLSKMRSVLKQVDGVDVLTIADN